MEILSYYINDLSNNNIVHCKICGLTIYKLENIITKGMKRHLIEKHSDIISKKYDNLNENILNEIENRKKLFKNDIVNSKDKKSRVLLSLISLCCTEGIYPDFLDSKIFNEFCNIAVNDLITILPDSKTIINNIAILSDKIRENVFLFLFTKNRLIIK